MSSNTWTVDPGQDWRDAHQEWLLEANVPGTERCQATFTGVRCELKAGHDNSHMIWMKARPTTQTAAGEDFGPQITPGLGAEVAEVPAEEEPEPVNS